MFDKDKLQNLISHIKENDVKDENELAKNKFCKIVLDRFNKNYNYWVKNCSFSIMKHNNLLDEKNISDGNGNIQDNIYLGIASILKEYLLVKKASDTEKDFLELKWDEFKENAHKIIDSKYEKYLEYILSPQFDIDIILHHLGDKSFQAFLNYEQSVKEAEEKSKQVDINIRSMTSRLETLLVNKTEQVNNLAKKLEEQKIAFNFVGLSSGFEKLLSKKNWAKWTSFSIMIIIFSILVILPMSFIGGRFLKWFSEYDIKWENIGWEQMLPVMGLELILVYFFRVVLNHYNSIQTQIMQIELRQALCQFIQSYADYAKEIKEKDGASLEKFENLIFSSIQSNSDKVVSTFDGLEQLANLIDKVKK